MMRAEKAFARFYKTPVNIYEVTRPSSYSMPAKTELLCSVSADIQPRDGGLCEEQYGFTLKRKFKMYCGVCGQIREGQLAEFDGIRCRITLVERRSIGTEAMLEEV